MPLLISKVPRALDINTKLFGFELGDLLLIFLYLVLSNLDDSAFWTLRDECNSKSGPNNI